MAICRMCHKSIPEGMDFCEECAIKRKNQADESYLDSLLSSVSGNSANSAVSTVRKKNTEPSHEVNDSIDDLLGDLDKSDYTPDEDVSLDSLLAGLNDDPSEPDIPEIDLDSIEPDVPEETEFISDVPEAAEEFEAEPIADITDIPETKDEFEAEPIADITDIPDNDALIGDMPGEAAELIDFADIPEDDENTGDIADLSFPVVTEEFEAEPIADIADIPDDNALSGNMPESELIDDIGNIPEESGLISDIGDIGDIPETAEEFETEPIADIADIPETAEEFETEPISDIPEDTGGIDDLMAGLSDAEAESDHSEPDNGEDMDELLSSLLQDMDNARLNSTEEENHINADDIEGLFDTAKSLIEPSETDHGDGIDIDGVLDQAGSDDITETGQPDLGDITDSGQPDLGEVSEIDQPDLGDITDIGQPDLGDITEIDQSDLSDISEIDQPDLGDITEIDQSGLSDISEIDVTQIRGEDQGTGDSGLGDIELIDLDSGMDLNLGDQNEASGSDEPKAPEIKMIDPITGNELDQDNIDMLFSEVGTDGSKEFLSEDDLANAASGGDDLGDLFREIDTGAFEEKIKNLSDEDGGKKGGKKKKKSLFERLFANIKEDLTPEQIREREEKAKAEEAAKKKAEEDKKLKAELTKEQKEAAKAEAKAKAEEEAKKKAEEKKRKAEEAKEKAKKKKEERLAIEEFEADEGRINRAGATILFVIFAILTIFIIVGTNIYSYNLSIETADKEFGEKHYNEAYYQVYGLKIKDKDIELVDKIMTAMYVQNALNSYNNYMYSNNEEKALDALLKGLQRYDKYLELAKLLGITEDLNYLKSQILVALDKDFDISEKKAYDMIAIRDDLDYSEYIYSLLGTYDLEIFE